MSMATQPDGDALQEALYAGQTYLLDPTGASSVAASRVRDVLKETLDIDDIRQAHALLSPDTFFKRIGQVRKTLFLDPEWHNMVVDVVQPFGFEKDDIAFDPIRLRVVTHEGHRNPDALPVYYPHRDTWYAHPQAAITWWIPLHDLGAHETFVLYPEMFECPVPNDSEIFDYNEWVRDGWKLKIGWQNREADQQARFPRTLGEVDAGTPLPVVSPSGSNLVFSGAHFHRTLEQATGQTRYSLDFRLVRLSDAESQNGAPNVDNRSRGSALRDYIRGRAL